MAGSPAQSLKEKSGSPVARSDPKRGGRELVSDEIVLNGCYTKKDHRLKRTRQDPQQRGDEIVEQDVNSPEYSLTTWTSHSPAIRSPVHLKYLLPRPEYWPNSPEHSPTTHDYILPGTDPNIRYDSRDGDFAIRTSFRAFTKRQYQEEKKFKRARRDSEQRINEKRAEEELKSPEYWPCSPEYWLYSSKCSPTTPPFVPEYRPMDPNHCQEAQDYTPASTDPNIRARCDSEQRINEKRAEEELKSPEYWPCSPEYCLYSSKCSPTTPPFVPEYRPMDPNHCQEAQDYTPASTDPNIRYGLYLVLARQDGDQRIDEKRADEELKSPEYSPTSYGLRSPKYWPESPTTPPYIPVPDWLPNRP